MSKSKRFPEGRPKTTETVRIPAEMLGAIDDFLKTERAKQMGYRFKTDVVTAAVRLLLDRYGYYPIPETTPTPLEHFNLNGNGVLILDRTMQPDRVIQVFFRPDGVYCEHCESDRCRHVDFALEIPKVQTVLRDKGWRIRAEKER